MYKFSQNTCTCSNILKGELHMRDINTVRKAVATMANQLYKLGYSLSQAFKTAWKRVKNSMKCRDSHG